MMQAISPEQTVYQDSWMKLTKETVRTDTGKEFEYLLSYPRPFVVVVPLLSEDEVLMIRHYKHGIQREVIAFPAGYMEDGETAAQSAARELQEETGRTARKLTRVATLSQNPSRCRTSFHIFLAEGLSERPDDATNADELEGEIATETVDLHQLLDAEFCNEIADGNMLAAIPFILNHHAS